MATIETDDDGASQDDDRIGFYLPAGPDPSRVPGRVERILTRLFRRRGRLERVLVPKY